MREGVDEELVRPMKGDNEGERRVGMRKKMKQRKSRKTKRKGDGEEGGMKEKQ